MDFTTENLIHFLNQKYPNEKPFLENTELRNRNIDGDNAIELLWSLEKNFDVSFKNFDFHRFFHEEIGIMRYLSWFRNKKHNENYEPLTVNRLYWYMKQLQN